METEELAEKLVSWIRDKVMDAGKGGAVVGLSGGVDSAVVAVLAKKAFPDNVLGLLLPCHSNQKDTEDAKRLAQAFSIPTLTIPLEGVLDCLLQALPPTAPERERLARGNLKPRLRMAALYYLANSLDYLVLGTGNRSEITVGYFTKYGDGGVDLLPLGNLAKTQVRKLALYLGIPEDIVHKTPSAGLWPGQTDEGEMGLTYKELDSYLLTGEARLEIKGKIEKMRATSQHKRSLPPTPPF